MKMKKITKESELQALGFNGVKLEMNGSNVSRVEFDAPNGERIHVQKEGWGEISMFTLEREKKKVFRCTVKHPRFGEILQVFDLKVEAEMFAGNDEHEINEVEVDV